MATDRDIVMRVGWISIPGRGSKDDPFFGVCRRCKMILARCEEHGGAVKGLNEEAAKHQPACAGAGR